MQSPNLAATSLPTDQVFICIKIKIQETHGLPAATSLPYAARKTLAIRVLVADDHALIRQGIKALLEKQGFQVVCEASDGQETLRSAGQTQPDVAISRTRGISEEKMPALPQYRDSALFSETERQVLEYADAMTRTPVEVPDALFAELRGKFTDAQTGGIDRDSGQR